MDDHECELRLGRFVWRVRDLTLDYCDANPNWSVSAGLTLFRVAMESLRYHIEDPLRPHVTWDTPSTMVPISVTLDDDLEPLPFMVEEDDLRNKKTVADSTLESISDMSLSFFLNVITRGVVIMKQGQEHAVRFPEDISMKLKKMSKSRREKRKAKLMEPEVFSLRFTSRDTNDGKGTGRIDVSMQVSFIPLYIDYNLWHGFYPICITLEFVEGNPKHWTTEQQAEFWQAISESMDSLIAEDNLEFLSGVIDDSRLVDVVVSEAVSRDRAAQYEDGLQLLASWEAWHLETTGEFASLNSLQQLGKMMVRLTAAQERDYERFDYKCRVKIDIPGTVPEQDRNRVFVNEAPLQVGDAMLAILLHLVAGLKEKGFGWVYLSDMVDSRVIHRDGKYQAIGRLRDRLRQALSGADAEAIVESGGSGKYRLSTHPSFVTYSRRKLLDHTEEDIKKIAEMLPPIRTTKK